MSEISPDLVVAVQNKVAISDMAKLQTKSDNINPFGGLFPIFRTFDKSGVRNVIDRTLRPRGTLLASFRWDSFLSDRNFLAELRVYKKAPVLRLRLINENEDENYFFIS